KADQSLFAKLNSQAVNPDGEATSSVEIKDIPDAVSIIKAIRVPVSLIYGDRSRFFDEAARRTAESLIHPDYLYPIKDAYHHLFLDQPVAFIDTLQQVLERILTRPTDRDDKSQEPPS
ncbi:MAG: alpha/beta hydrolase, partial [Gammaproteobacteria bacterium]|nr:alpha/beta hydrolase [Gammaproteobacteria bacterium]